MMIDRNDSIRVFVDSRKTDESEILMKMLHFQMDNGKFILHGSERKNMDA